MKLELTPQEASDLIEALWGRMQPDDPPDIREAVREQVVEFFNEAHALSRKGPMPWVADARATRDMIEESLERPEQT